MKGQNNMKKMKIISVIAPMFLLATSLTGCGIKGLGSADTYDLDVTVDTRGAHISIWTPFGQEITKVMGELIEDFEAKTGIVVEHESKGAYDKLQTAINLSATQRKFPNVSFGYPDHFAGYINSNIQLRLDGLLENDSKRAMVGQDEEGYPVDADGIRAMDYDDFYTDYTKENETLEFDKDGNNYILGLPFNKSTEVMAYNKQFFDWCATQDDLKDNVFVPTTWQEVLTVGRAVKTFFTSIGAFEEAHKLYCSDRQWRDALPDPNPDKITIAFDASNLKSADDFYFFSYDATANLFTTSVKQYGGVFVELDTTKTGVGYVAFNDAEYRQSTLNAMKMWRDLDAEHLCAIPATFEALYCSDSFKKGQTILNVGSSAGIRNCVGNFEMNVAAIPQNADSEQKYVISQGTNLCLFNKGTEKERVAAWKLMVYLSQQANDLFCISTGYFPSCKAAATSSAYQDYLENSIKESEIQAQNCAKLSANVYRNPDDTSWTVFTDPAFRGSSAVRNEVGNVPGYIMYSKTDYPTDQDILNALYIKLADYVRS